QGARQPGVIEQIQLVIPRGRVAPARGDIDHTDLVTRLHQMTHHMGAYEPTAPDHRNLHSLPLPDRVVRYGKERDSSERRPRAHLPAKAPWTAATAASTSSTSPSVLSELTGKQTMPG